MLRGKRILITGGTGSFGHFMVRRILPHEPAEIRIFSRDEKKQFDMRHEFAAYPSVTFIVGDVRDVHQLRQACGGIDIVFHAAALKQVPNCELFPMEAVKTNVLGAENLITVAIENNVERVVAVSTDKAVKPVNVMGMTKALQERLIINANQSPRNHGTRFCCVRYGNVMGSRGSVIPLFKRQLRDGKPLTVTRPEMTRFMLTFGDAADLVLYAMEHTEGGELFVKKAPSAYIVTVAEALIELAGAQNREIRFIGQFAGEKIHEILISEEEATRCQDHTDYFVVSPWSAQPVEHAALAEYCSRDHLVGHDVIRELLLRSDREMQEMQYSEGYFVI
jgi:UDP-N-acetylglucosamine 4,6-dehydratase